MINIGFGNYVAKSKIVAVISPESAPVKRLISSAKANDKLVDATYGRSTRAVIVTESGQIILASIVPDTLAGRFEDIKGDK